MRGRADFSFAIGMLRRNSALFLFPVLSAAVVGVVSLVLLAPFGLQLIQDAAAGTEPGRIGPFTIALLVICLVVDAFLVMFFNGALMAEALVVVRGGHASVGHGLSAATRRAPQIFAWGLVTATVGLILSALRERGGIGGVLLSFVGGLAWGIATLFVLPVVMVEGLYPIGAIKRSVAILRTLFGPDAALGGIRKAWGYGIGYLLVVFGGIVLAVALIVVGIVAQTVVVTVPAIIGAVLVFALVAIVASALGAMVSAVLYVYAVDHTTPQGVDGALLQSGLAAR
jgi:hypothetical protein